MKVHRSLSFNAHLDNLILYRIIFCLEIVANSQSTYTLVHDVVHLLLNISHFSEKKIRFFFLMGVSVGMFRHTEDCWSIYKIRCYAVCYENKELKPMVSNWSQTSPDHATSRTPHDLWATVKTVLGQRIQSSHLKMSWTW